MVDNYQLVALLGAGVILWFVTGRWELRLGPQCQTRILKWKTKWLSKAQPYTWHVQEEDVARDFWHLRREIPQLEEEFQTRLFIQLRIQQCPPGDSTVYRACLQRRFPEILVNGEELEE